MENYFLNLDNKKTSKSITCTNIPKEFLDKAVAKKHFSSFGTIKSFSLRPKNYSCSVEFESVGEAIDAQQNGNVFNDYTFTIEFTDEQKASISLDIDPDVQMELHAMKGGSSFSEPVQRQATYIKKLPRYIKPDVFNIEIEQLLRKQSNSIEDKYRILDARDKLIRQYQLNQKGKCLIGTCPDMCPEKERVMREFQMQVASFEISPKTNQMDHRLAVKQYSRSSADQETPLPHELRPESVLRMSMNYLLSRIVDLSEDPKTNISDWFHFVWDRMRSIRKDITQQDLCTLEAVTLVEQCARFHIHCSARLVGEDPSVFDQKINTENLTKCLQTLKYMYRDLRLQNINCPNEAEFRAYVVLLNLNDGNFLWEFQQFPDDIIKANQLKFALLVYQAVENNNYVRFFQLVSQTTYLNACILLRYFTQVRLKTLRILLKAYSPKNPSKFSLKEFSRVLKFEDVETVNSFLEYHGLTCDFEAIYLDKQNFYYPDFPYSQKRSINLVESKMTSTVGEMINGSPFTKSQMTFIDNHQLQNSFDEHGYLKSDTFDNILALSKAQESENVFKVPQIRTVSPKPKKLMEISTIPVVNKDTIINTHTLFPILTPPQSSESTSIGSEFNFRLGLETNNEDLIQSKEDKIPQTTISLPTIDFAFPQKKEIPQVERTPESIITKPFQTPTMIRSPLTPSLTPSSASSNTPINEDTVDDATNIQSKLKLIEDSAMNLSNELVLEVTSMIIQKYADDAFTRNKYLSETLPKQYLSIIIDELLHDVLTEMSETELLVEQILEARKLRNLFKVVKHWKFITKRNIFRKQQLISAPNYMTNFPLSEIANEFRHPFQRKTNEILKDQLVGNTIDHFEIVANEFKSTSQMNHWKAILSIPDKNEDSTGKFPVLINNWLKAAFLFDTTDDTLTVKKYVKKLKHDLALCLKIIKGIEGCDDCKSANGVIFIIDHQNIKSSNDRWKYLISKLPNNDIPIAIIVCNNNGNSIEEIRLNFNDIRFKQINIILHATNVLLKVSVEQGLRYIAKNSNKIPSSLKMDLTEACLLKVIGEEFWSRVISTINENEALYSACKRNCNFLVTIFNKALDTLIRILGHPFSNIVMFPPELKKYVNEAGTNYPKSFENFPNDWSEQRKLSELTEFLKSLHIPDFNGGPPKDLATLKNQISNYIHTVLGDGENIFRLISLAQMYIFPTSDTQKIEVGWEQIIRLVAVQNLQNKISNFKTVPFVVYDYLEMFKFMNEPWWLTLEVVKKIKNDMKTNTSNAKKRKSIDDNELTSDEISKILKTGENTLKKFELRSSQKGKTPLPQVDSVVTVFKEAESYFKKNKILWKDYEEQILVHHEIKE